MKGNQSKVWQETFCDKTTLPAHNYIEDGQYFSIKKLFHLAKDSQSIFPVVIIEKFKEKYLVATLTA
jgi:hypothetical protein